MIKTRRSETRPTDESEKIAKISLNVSQLSQPDTKAKIWKDYQAYNSALMLGRRVFLLLLPPD